MSRLYNHFKEEYFINEQDLHATLQDLRKKILQKFARKECAELLATLDMYQNDFHIFLEGFRQKTPSLNFSEIEDDKILNVTSENLKGNYQELINEFNFWMSKLVKLKKSMFVLSEQTKKFAEIDFSSIVRSDQENLLEQMQGAIFKIFLSELEKTNGRNLFSILYNTPLVEMQMAEFKKLLDFFIQIKIGLMTLPNFGCQVDLDKFIKTLEENRAQVEDAFSRCRRIKQNNDQAELARKRADTLRAYINLRNIFHSPIFDNDPSSRFVNRFLQLKLELQIILQKNDFENEHHTFKRLIEDYPGWNINRLYRELFPERHGRFHDVISNKYFLELFKRLDKLEAHARNLLRHQRDKNSGIYGQITLDLALDLKEKARQFFSIPENSNNQHSKENFNAECLGLLFSYHDFMKTHRHYQRKKVADIIKGILLILSIIGAPLYGLITKRNPFRLFKEHRTRRKELTAEVAEIVKMQAAL